MKTSRPYRRPLATTMAAMFVCAALAGTSAADDQTLIGRWQFVAEHLDSETIEPLAGPLTATVHGPIQFAKEKPHALLLDGNSQPKSSVLLASELSKANLPEAALTVEAWVRVDKVGEWGGIVGAFQDNGGYERGWLLGTHKSRFCFAVAASEGDGLTYLSAPQSFDPGYWYHVVGTYDGKVQRLYVDGKPVAESTEQRGTIVYPEKGTFAVGAYVDDDEFHPITGQVEQVSLWSQAFGAANVAEQFASRKSRFPEIDADIPAVADWPTYLRDNQRTGISGERLQFPLKLKWVHHARHAPRPAWPAPAKHDYWHKKYNMQARVTYDRAYHVVAAGDAVYFATSADDRVCCLDANTGRLRWSYFTQGPVRNAPTIDDGKVLFGADDGYVYCLGAADGSLIWKHRLGSSDRKIAGNERVISPWPVRTGVLVDEGVAFACAGLFPTQGVFQTAIDVETGEVIDSATINVSAQGYLEQRGGRLFVSTGRDPAGAFVRGLQRRGKGVGKELASFQEDYPYAFAGAADVRFGGGDGKVAAFSTDDGRKLWSAEVDGRAYSIAIAQGNLLVSTNRGKIYCFSSDESAEAQQVEPAPPREFPYPDEDTQQRYSAAAEWILSKADVRLGYCLVLDSGDGRLAYELARQSDLQIVAVEPDPQRAAELRRNLEAAGLYGRVVVHEHPRDADLPYTDYLFNIVCGDAIVAGDSLGVSRDEITRVLRPHGGLAVFALTDDGLHRRGPLEGMGEWSHMYADAANTVCSGDEHVAGPMRLQWFGRPGPRQMIDRHHRTVAPLWKDGRLFVPAEDRIIAADAYNGTPLWNVEMPGSRRVVAFRDCSYMAAADDYVYVAAGDRCYGLNVETGYKDVSFQLPDDPSDAKREWGYVAVVDDLLVGSAQQEGASRRDQSYEVDTTVTYWDFIPVVCGNQLFAYDRQSGEPRWQYDQPAGLIINATITIGDGKMFFVESRDAGTLDNKDGRAPLSQLLGNGSNIVALDLQTGKTLWKQPHDLSGVQHILYAAYSQGKLAVAGSSNSGTDKDASVVQYDIHVLDADSGDEVWSKTQDQGTKIGGDHGEQDHHPVIVGEKLYCEPFAYNLHTGEPISDFAWLNKHRRGCGNISASANTFFFRQSHPTMFDLTTNTYAKVTETTRPGCWINIIPAGGLLLIPEASSGCSCDYPVQTSLAFLPSGASGGDADDD